MRFHSLRLPLVFDVARLQGDLAKVSPDQWVSHYNSADYEGQWSGAALRSLNGTVGQLYAGVGSEVFQDTQLLGACDYFREVVSALPFPHKAVRLLRLHPGSIIREHSDPALGFEDGEIRIHIPIRTNSGVRFYLDGRRVQLEVGEVWYLDLSRPHRVENQGSSDRVHLVIDGVVNDWVKSLFEGSARTSPPWVLAEQSQFDLFRERVYADRGLQDRLLAAGDQAGFIAATVQAGSECGFPFSEQDVDSAIRAGRRAWILRGAEVGHDDNLSSWAGGVQGVGGVLPIPRGMPSCPTGFEGWMPIRMYWQDSEPRLEWVLLGEERFTDPFFEQTIQRRLRHPFHQAFRRQTDIDALGQWYADSQGLPPRAFIFHMSRCGSTLLSRTLSALDQNVVLSEAPPIDSVLRSYLRDPNITPEQRAKWLRWILSALGQKRNPAEHHLFVKFDAWNIADLPVIRLAFPEVPWIFLYRDPLEVLVSQLNQPSPWTFSGAFNPAELPHDEYCARALAQVCETALLHSERSGGMLVNYSQLPEFAWTEFPDYVGVRLTARDREHMKELATQNAKTPGLPFEPDSVRKQNLATPRMRELAAHWLDAVFLRLEGFRVLNGPEPICETFAPM